MNNDNNIPWIEKYRPRKLIDMYQTKNLINLFNNNIKTGDMVHYLFYGPPGTGKTSAILAIGREIFKEHFKTRVIEFNASDDRGINAVREKIYNEAKKYVSEIILDDGTIIPPYKIIILDEADSMTDEAQDALRVIIEQYSTVSRFCFICNYISKITDAIKSRCSLVYFKKLDNNFIIKKLNQICLIENIKISKKNMDVIIEVSKGDMRKAIILLQNIKYLYNLKKKNNFIKNFIDKNKICDNIILEEDDIYNIAATISNHKANEIIEKIILVENITEIMKLTNDIISLGYPIDNILYQLNKNILETNKINDLYKAKIIFYTGNIFLKIKESSNEYIQLLDYLLSINQILKNNKAYKINK